MNEWFECEHCGCGVKKKLRDLPRQCCGIDGVCDETLAVEWAEKATGRIGSKLERRWLAAINDERALDAFTAAFIETDLASGSHATVLASIASPDSFELMSKVARNPATEGVFQQAMRYLARLDTEESRSVLYEVADRGGTRAALLLQQLSDSRADELLLEELRRLEDPSSRLEKQKHVGQAFVDRASRQHVEILRDRLAHYARTEERVGELLRNEQWREHQVERRREKTSEADVRALLDGDQEFLREMLARKEGPSVVSEIRIEDEVELRKRAQYRVEILHDWLANTISRIESILEADDQAQDNEAKNTADSRTETVYSLHAVEDDTSTAITRFGGQPTWLAEPTWPTFQDRPMQFWGQFELPWDSEALAYLFVESRMGWMQHTEDGSASLFTQPRSKPPSEPWEHRSQGPLLPFSHYPADAGVEPPRHDKIVPRVASMTEYQRPPNGLTHNIEWNRIGGTPLWLQGDESLGPDWRFLFQFSAGLMGNEIADVAECYGFVHDDGRGIFLWQCH